MAMCTQRFGIRNTSGARSSEWVVMWKTNTSDVYLATRTLGGALKASVHASGRCHVRTPNPEAWRGAGHPPQFLDTWNIDTASTYAFPFSVVVPEQELRSAEWAQHKEKGTLWIQAPEGRGVEVAIFLVRTSGDLSGSLRALGWHTIVVDATLPDSRRLLVVARDVALPEDRLAELERAKVAVRAAISRKAVQLRNPRLLLMAGANEQGTRKFVEAAVL
jgi:hypothetical protein